MAIWHFRCYFIPDTELKRESSKIPSNLSWETFNNDRWWNRSQRPAQVASCLSALYGPAENRGLGIQTWHIGPHSFNLYFEPNGEIELLESKADAREQVGHFLESVVHVAKSLNCVLYLGSRHIVSADLPSLTEAFKQSLAYQFVLNPEKALSDTSRPEFEAGP